MSVFVAFLLVSANAAADPQPVAAPQVASAVPAPEKVKAKKICKSDESDPGSHMVKRVCKTAEEWNQNPSLGMSRSGFSIKGEAMQGH